MYDIGAASDLLNAAEKKAGYRFDKKEIKTFFISKGLPEHRANEYVNLFKPIVPKLVKKNPSRKRRGAAKRKARKPRKNITLGKLAVRSVAAPKKRMRKRRKIMRVRKNPLPKFAIVAHVGKKKFYLRQSTGSFIVGKADATHFKSKALAVRTARAILKQLPSKIASLGIERI